MVTKCPKCLYERKESDMSPDYECPSCGIIYAKFKAKKNNTENSTPPQVEQEVVETQIFEEAEQLHLQASIRLNKCSAHIEVYDSRSDNIIQEAKNGIEFIDAALKLMPNNPNYLNTKALLHADGLGKNKLGLSILKEAAKKSPNDIQIKQNIRALEKLGNKKLGSISIREAITSIIFASFIIAYFLIKT